MSPLYCALYTGIAGASGGFVNALISDNGFALPRKVEGVWCPGAVSTVLLGAFAAFASWAFYGSGAGIDIADQTVKVHLQLSALAGAFLIGVVGGKWITNEADKRLLSKSVEVAATKALSKQEAQNIVSGSPMEVLQDVAKACANC